MSLFHQMSSSIMILVTTDTKPSCADFAGMTVPMQMHANCTYIS
jgi:hypothetical protein